MLTGFYSARDHPSWIIRSFRWHVVNLSVHWITGRKNGNGSTTGLGYKGQPVKDCKDTIYITGHFEMSNTCNEQKYDGNGGMGGMGRMVRG